MNKAGKQGARNTEERLGLVGTLVLHSQFILIALLVAAAVVLKVLYE